MLTNELKRTTIPLELLAASIISLPHVIKSWPQLYDLVACLYCDAGVFF